jgi:hypothetical protein
MIVIGINGHLMDAVFKARVLQGYAERSVRLIVTPCCRPLREFFRRIRSVATVEVDETSEYRAGHGEQSPWTYALDLDTTYPGYPSEWCVNYVASYSGLPSIRREDWFGSFRYVLGQVLPEDFAIYVGGVSDQKRLASTIANMFPGLAIVSADPAKDCFENICRSARCAVRVVGFDATAALMSAVGLSCIVERGDRPPGRYDELFLSFGEHIVRTEDLFDAVAEAVHAASIRHHRPTQEWLYPRVAICLSTLCLADLMSDSLPTLAAQIRDHDAIFVLNDSQPILAEALNHAALHFLEGNQNPGVASSWNQLLEHTLLGGYEQRFDWALLFKDKIGLRENQLQSMKKTLAQAIAQRKWMVVGPNLESVVAMNRACIENVGLFDPGFIPPHFVDKDYYQRLCVIDSNRCLVAGHDFETEEIPDSVAMRPRPEMGDSAQIRFLKKAGVPLESKRYIPGYGNRGTQEAAAAPVIARPIVNRPATVLICLPTYHRTELLARAIESLREQTYDHFEAWIVKDGCQNACTIKPRNLELTCLECAECRKTIAFAQRICAVDERFRFFCLNINFAGGGWGPRNFAMMNTSHPLIAYLDDDNWYEPEHLESLVGALQEDCADLAFTGSNLYRGSSLVGHRFQKHPPSFGRIDTSEILHRRELIARSGGWRDNRFYGPTDWDLVKRWLESGLKWVHTGRITVNYSVKTASVMKPNIAERFIDVKF